MAPKTRKIPSNHQVTSSQIPKSPCGVNCLVMEFPGNATNVSNIYAVILIV
jgi:hypothetical protein